MTTVMLNAQVVAIPFYERHGFASVGPRFMEAGIEHQGMARRFVAKRCRRAGQGLPSTPWVSSGNSARRLGKRVRSMAPRQCNCPACSSGSLDAPKQIHRDLLDLVSVAQFVFEPEQQGGRHFGVGQRPVKASATGQVRVFPRGRQSLWLWRLGRILRESSSEQTNSCRLLRWIRASSASQNLQSKEALWATSG